MPRLKDSLRGNSSWSLIVTTGVLVVLSNGPVFAIAKWINGYAVGWSHVTVASWFAGAATVSVVLSMSFRERMSGVRPASAALLAIAAYTLIATASTLWSVDPVMTLWRSLIYVGLALLAVHISQSEEGELRLTLTALASVAVFGSLAVLAAGFDGAVDANGDWQGMYTNRNSLAPLGALGVIAGLRNVCEAKDLPTLVCDRSLRKWQPRRSRRLVGGAILCGASVVVLIGAGSRTAWVSLMASLAISSLAPMYHTIARHSGIATARRLVTTAVGLLGITAIAATMALWHTATFAQRRTIWQVVWEWIRERPVGGYGFFAFFDQPDLVATHDLLTRGSAHNSLVEVALGLGILGVMPFVVIVVFAARNALTPAWRAPSPDSWMWCAVVIVLLVENLTESFVLWFSYNWVLLLAAALRQPQRATVKSRRFAAPSS